MLLFCNVYNTQDNARRYAAPYVVLRYVALCRVALRRAALPSLTV